MRADNFELNSFMNESIISHFSERSFRTAPERGLPSLLLLSAKGVRIMSRPTALVVQFGGELRSVSTKGGIVLMVLTMALTSGSMRKPLHRPSEPEKKRSSFFKTLEPRSGWRPTPLICRQPSRMRVSVTLRASIRRSRAANEGSSILSRRTRSS